MLGNGNMDNYSFSIKINCERRILMNITVTIEDNYGNKISSSEIIQMDSHESKEDLSPEFPYVFITKTAPDQPILVESDRLIKA